jgi:hypothetical protein
VKVKTKYSEPNVTIEEARQRAATLFGSYKER